MMAEQKPKGREHEFAFQGKFVIEGILECMTGVRIGGTTERFEIGGIENPVIKDPLTELPYLPGSSLKGKLRHLLEWAHDLDAVQKLHPKHKIFTACHCGKCVACRLFGPASDETEVRIKAGPTRLTVRDAFPTGYEALLNGKEPPKGTTVQQWNEMLGKGIYTEIKSENVLDRLTAAATPRTMERIPAGSKFHVEFVLDVYHKDDKELLKALAEAIQLLEHSSIGGSGSRGYGKVKFTDLKVTWYPKSYYLTGKGEQFKEVGDAKGLHNSVDEIWCWVKP